jgi:hypothetical protein
MIQGRLIPPIPARERLRKLKGIVGLKAIYLIGADQNKKIDAPSIANLRNDLPTISLHPIP